MGTGASLGLRCGWRGVFAVVAVAALLAPSMLAPARTAAQDWSPPRTVFVAETGHTADGLFLDLWRSRPLLLGDPITEEFQSRTGFSAATDQETIVQYYENVALVYLPDAAPEEQVQLLDLGRQEFDRLRSRGDATLRDAERPGECPASGSACVVSEATGYTVRGTFLGYWRDAEEGRWLGQPIAESYRAADGSYVQYFEHGALRLDRAGDVAPLPLGKAVAMRQKLDTEPIAQPDGVPLYDEALFVPPPATDPLPEEAPDLTDDPETESEPQAVDLGWSPGTFGPGPQSGGWREIVVSISAQALWAYENGELVTSTYVSTGTGEYWETTTPTGYFTILSKYDTQTMSGNIRGEEYLVPDVPSVMYFDDLGNALHGTYWHSNFGTPMSHGCVNLPLDVAAFVYGWADVGTPVIVLP